MLMAVPFIRLIRRPSYVGRNVIVSKAKNVLDLRNTTGNILFDKTF